MKTTRASFQTLPVVALFLVSFAVSLHGASVNGDAKEVASDVHHPNGNIYDQVLLTGTSANVQADTGQVIRISFVDLNDDIVQVEYSGKGLLTLTLENATGPALAAKYNQPDVFYMKGHVRISISDTDATSNVSVFSVGPSNAANSAIIKSGETYDGVADLAEIEINADPQNPAGGVFGGIRAGNASFWAHAGRTGIYAPQVHVQTVARIGDLMAFDTAHPALVFGASSQFESLEVSLGRLAQPNGRLIEVGYHFPIWFLAGGDIEYFHEPAPGSLGTFWYLIGPDGTHLLWVIPPTST